MGTHNYLVEIVMREKGVFPTEKSLTLCKVNPRATNSVARFLEERRGTFLTYHGCREALTNSASEYFYPIEEKFYRNFLFAYRCFGEQYTSVANIMENSPDSCEKLSDFLSEMFKLSFKLDYGKIQEDSFSIKGLGKYRIAYTNYSGKQLYKYSNGYITIYIPSWEKGSSFKNFPIKMSAITGILREPKIISGILSDKITDREELCERLVELAYERLTKRDSSYFCITLSGSSTEGVIKETLKEKLAQFSNFDGSGWGNILSLSCYIFHLKSSRLPKTFGSNGVHSYVYDHFSRNRWRLFSKCIHSTDALNRFVRGIKSHLANNVWYSPSNMLLGLNK